MPQTMQRAAAVAESRERRERHSNATGKERENGDSGASFAWAVGGDGSDDDAPCSRWSPKGAT